MLSYRELLIQNVDRSNSFIKKIDRKRTVVHMLDVQNLCLDPGGADFIQSVGGAPSGADTLGPAKKVLERARAEGFPILWSLWGLQPDGSDAGIGKYKAPSMCSGAPDAPGSHGTWNGQLVKGFDPLRVNTSSRSIGIAAFTGRRLMSICVSTTRSTSSFADHPRPTV